MNLDISMLTVPIGGATIGYITNWLAIKMLFRPYNEKRLFGVKIPFTPGLIPKERNRIATSIGDVVGNYLLTNDLIIDELTKVEVQNKVVGYIDNFLFNNSNEIKLFDIISDYIDDEKTFDYLNSVLTNQIKDMLLDQNIVSIITEKFTIEIIKVLETINLKDQEYLLNSLIKNVVTSNETKKIISSQIDTVITSDASINRIFGPNLTNHINTIINSNEENVKTSIIEFLNKPKISSQVKEMISKVLMEKVGALGAMFVDPDSIYISILNTIDTKLSEITITDYINNYLNQVFTKEFSELMTENNMNLLKNEMNSSIMQILSKINISSVIINLDVNLYEILNKATYSQIDNIIAKYINNQITNIDEKVINKLSRSFVTKLINELKSHPISVSDEKKYILNNIIKSKYTNFIEQNVPVFASSNKLVKLVEDNINSFEIDFLEKIILDIAKKELQAITWLGALLGFIMSLFILVL